MLNLACGIANQGIKVDLLLTKAEGEYLDKVPEDIRLIDFNAANFGKDRIFNLPTGLASTGSLFKLIAYLKQEQPLALLSATHYPNEIAIIAKHLAKVGTRVIVSEHTTLSVEAAKVEQVSARFIPITARFLYPRADGIVTVSDGVAEDLSQITSIGKDKIEVIYNPVITSDLLVKAKETVDHPWFQPGEVPVILGIGRLVAQKDFSTLIRAFAKVRQLKRARLMILGSGREEEKLKALARELGIEEDIAWMGFVDNPFAYMQRAKLFVLSSVWEGLPTVLIEALAVGVSVVSTNCESGPQEILAGGKYGKLVSVGDSEGMAGAILRVLSGESKRVDSGWLKQFTLENSVQKYLEILGVNKKGSILARK
ncbi:MAG TPA: glycosyl transferase [Cyanobacteria bacterium UBA11149]|nr:glycosyl transferase [Cyanobacteria bacterium UBA11367]HBE57952.1 glycosyl transferase [Cyanobacteria bacterium UBA11366]HBK62859.1 glycosyl transferase [Cyanobacteria bacterium UBA11166]HBR76025.1 glycosyl transferase [Cyanobacteria bacterium UBA11159]HBS71037.1 glycosyl transferase [Cyanobacteria bacterium UBA11153]HBW90881.1 glycosyl transferase [Cyanobacteria bacterium UBA11149]HCA96214.1 glycosyl transferase [Cyanobacteria bacterium UBA9226]